MDYEVGASSIVYADEDLETAAAEMAAAGVDAVDLSVPHLDPSATEAEVEAALALLDRHGLAVRGYGVVDLAEPEEVEAWVALAARIDADYVAVNYPPARDDVTRALAAAAEEYDVDVGIHNYSTVHHDDLSAVFSSAADLRRALEVADSDRVGVCVDTGHFLVLEEDPAAVLEELGERVVGVHLKDTSDVEVEDAPGRGELDLEGFLALVTEHTDARTLIVEFELEANRTERLRGAAERVRALVAPDSAADRP
jgi:sugar phosphate isomerase/epimerase